MLSIISTVAIQSKFEKKLRVKLQIDQWFTLAKMPFSECAFQQFVVKYNLKNTKFIMILPLRGKDITAICPTCNGSNILSYFFYTQQEDIHQWIASINAPTQKLTREALVLSMMKPFYEKWANKFYRFFKHEKQNYKAKNLLPERTTNKELAATLSKGTDLAIYVGHGRSRGWSAYRGFRWKHVTQYDQAYPIRILISLSCSNLKQDKKESLPFGLQWTMSGRNACFFGASGAVKIQPLIQIANILMDSLKIKNLKTIGDLVLKMDQTIQLKNEDELSENWQMFKLIGNPLELI